MVIDIDSEDDEKYEIVHNSGSVMSSSVMAVEFVVTAESLIQLRVVQRDHQNSTRPSVTAEQQDRHGVNSCTPCTDVTHECTANVVTTAR